MGMSVKAIYENGVFKPLERVSLPEGARVFLRVEFVGRSEDDADVIVQQRPTLEHFLAELEVLPHIRPDDGLSGEDPDQNFYDGPREDRP